MERTWILKYIFDNFFCILPGNQLVCYAGFNQERIDPNNNSDMQRFSHFGISVKCQHLIGITNLLPMGKFFDTFINVDY